MRRILLTIQYNGAAYNGWQRQNNALGVQMVVEDALHRLLGHETVIHASGRTDAGVHAYGQTAHFDTENQLTMYKLINALNAFLPFDIRITDAKAVDSDFHARYSVRTKTYIYKMYVGSYEDVFERGRAHRIYKMPDIDAMREAAEYLIGRHHFDSFANTAMSVTTTDRTVSRLAIMTDQIGQATAITLKITADGFLYNMVRIIAAVLLRVGEGKLAVSDVPKILNARDRKSAPWLLPAYGLYLYKVQY